MTKQWWTVTTRTTVNRTYRVYAEHEKAAETLTIGSQYLVHEEDENEETMSIIAEAIAARRPT